MIDVERQYKAVREGIGLIDRSDVGKLVISGEDKFTWLQGMVSNDVRLLEQQGMVMQACVLSATGQILSDVILMHDKDTRVISLVLPRVNLNKILTLFDRYIIMEDVEVKDYTEEYACVSVQGPGSLEWPFKTATNATPDSPWDIAEMSYEIDHSGSGGYDFFFNSTLKEEFLHTAKDNSLELITLEVQEILRIEAWIPKYGVDMDETTLAPEAGLMPTHISLTKGCYVGQEIIARIDSRGHTNRALTGLVFEMGDVPASGDKIIVVEESGGTRETGRVTSVIVASPAMSGHPIAMGYVRHEHRTPGNRLQVQGANGTHAAQIVELPFYSRPKLGTSPTRGVEIGT